MLCSVPIRRRTLPLPFTLLRGLAMTLAVIALTFHPGHERAQANQKAPAVEFSKAAPIEKPEARALLGGKDQVMQPQKGHSFWVVTLTAPMDLQKKLDPKLMAIMGADRPISATGWAHTTTETSSSFMVGVSAGSSKIGGEKVPKAYLHILFEIPDKETPAKFDWKTKAKPLVEQFK